MVDIVVVATSDSHSSDTGFESCSERLISSSFRVTALPPLEQAVQINLFSKVVTELKNLVRVYD